MSRRWPAEWEPHAGTALTWPHNPDTWHKGLAGPRAALAEAIVALAADEVVHLHCADNAERARLCDALGLGDDRLILHDIASNDAWCRDHGAIIVREADGARTALDFGYNAWGGKYPPWDADAAIAAQMAGYLGCAHEVVDVVLEGGAIEGNGQGLMMCTAASVLNTNRNAALTRAAAEAHFADWFGTTHTLWLDGEIPGDDTDAHIDNLARFVSPAAVLIVAPEAPRAGFETTLAANLVALQEQCARHQLGVTVQRLPVPRAFIEANQLPASYANFYIGNGVVLAPVYNDPADAAALAALEGAFPERRVVPVDCRELIVGLGSLHCLTQQIPA